MQESHADPRPEQLLLNTRDAAKLLSISDRHIRELIATGAIRSIKIGRRRLVPRSALAAYVESLLAASDIAD